MKNKITIFLQARNIIKNWYVLPSLYFKFGKEKYVILKINSGLKIKLRKHSTDLMQFATIWLINEYSKPGFSIRDDDVIIDIGSHIGIFALYASQFCKNGKIFCFEPVKENYDLLIENLNLNKISNVIAVNKAISDIDGKVTMFLNEDASGHNLIEKTKNEIKVSSISLKTFFEENIKEKCNLVKMDCEGSEYSIIESLPTTYFKNIEKMIIEYHFAEKKLENFQKLEQKLKSCLFDVKKEKYTDNMGMIFAKK